MLEFDNVYIKKDGIMIMCVNLSDCLREPESKEDIEKRLLELFLPHITDDKREIDRRPENQFTLDDLKYCQFQGNMLVRNPKPYNLEIESPNPEYFLVINFGDRKLLVENWGDGECGHQEFYYYDGKEVRYAHELFLC